MPILLVDDDDGIRLLVEELLRTEGYSVVVGHNGIEALRLLRATPNVGLLLMDLHMPGLSGWQVLGALRQSDDRRSVPVVLMTGADDTVPVEVAGVLRKPFEIDELFGLVRQHYLGDPSGEIPEALRLESTRRAPLRRVDPPASKTKLGVA